MRAESVLNRIAVIGAALLLTTVASAVIPPVVEAQLKLSRLFGDGAVVQRDVEVPVWGWAATGMDVQVTLLDNRASARADKHGRWEVRLPAMDAGGPYALTVRSDDQEIVIRDVFVGDVWVCSGQSNMEWEVRNAMNAEAEISAANDLMIRHFKVPRSWSETPSDELAGGEWRAAVPEHVGDFTAVGYFFARHLRHHVDVPIGLLHTSWGGTRIEPWISAEALAIDQEELATRFRHEEEQREQVLATIREKFGDLPGTDGGYKNGKPVWADPELDDSAWYEIEVPGVWERSGFEGMDGFAWYRTSFRLSADEAQAGVRLGLGMIDDSDVSFVNGAQIGSMEMSWTEPRVYEVSPENLKEGQNVVAIRVEDTGGGGGIHGDAANLFVEAHGKRRPLSDTWRFNIGAVTVNVTQRQQIPAVLFNKMIHPLLPYPIKGFLWYQGESNAGAEDAFAYRELFKDLIQDWRRQWGGRDFPFLFVQLANFMAADTMPSNSSWALLRESQRMALALAKTGQAVTIDVGDADDIHPRNKQEVGRRLALAARHIAYGEDLVHSGPEYADHSIEDDTVVIEFDHVGTGLAVGDDGDLLGGFAISGTDQRFVWAKARIAGDRVEVWSDDVPEPVAVRYAWGNNPVNANLYNREGLPASPFRTDTW